MAVGITAMLVTLMLTIISNVLGGWNRSSGVLTGGNQSRVVLDQLSTDLQGAIIKKDGNVWLAATVLSDSVTNNGSAWTTASGGHAKPLGANGSGFLTGRKADGTADITPSASYTPDLTTYRFGRSGIWLRFFTTVPDLNSATDKLSAPRAVSYQMLRKGIGTGLYRYQLYRAEVRPGATSGTNSTFNMGYNLFMTAASPGYNTADTTDGNAGNVRKPTANQLIANNVVDFGVRLWDSTSVIFPKTASHAGVAVTSSASASAPDGVTVTTASSPVAAEVFVRILSDEGARLLTSYESGQSSAPSGMSADEYWWQLVEANSQVYTRRIDIKSTPQ